VVRDVDLERGDTRQTACRGPDLGWKIRKRRQVVAGQRALVSEPVAGELHPIAGVSCETNHHLVDRLDFARFVHRLGLCRHGSSTPLAGVSAATVAITFSPACPWLSAFYRRHLCIPVICEAVAGRAWSPGRPRRAPVDDPVRFSGRLYATVTDSSRYTS